MLTEVRELLHAVPSDSDIDVYKRAVIADNALGKQSDSARQRTFRYLRELYGLDLAHGPFRILRVLWEVEAETQPLLAMLSALSRDPALRATAPAILAARLDEALTSHDLAASVQRENPGDYKDSVAAKIGRNALSSWQQSGHLVATSRTTKARACAICRPPAVAYALFLGREEGGAGQGLFATLYARVLDVAAQVARDQAFEAAQRAWIDYREVGGIVEVGFRGLERGAV
jgi:hypothetical protein